MKAKLRSEFLQTKRLVGIINRVGVEKYVDELLLCPKNYRDAMIELIKERLESFEDTFGGMDK